MAGIAGIYCAKGRPADNAELRRMVAAVDNRGPDGISYWNSGPVALAHLQFHTTPESLHERQPLLSPDGEACLVWNGRIDNREELLAALAAKGASIFDSTDPGLVLAAYLAWGTDCLQHLVGDFALAIWDGRLRRLWCARDYIGIRPFYYFWNEKTFLFGPEIRALLAHPLVSLKINEGMVGEYLADNITSRDETLYSDIRRLPAGSTLTIDASGSFRISSWWNPELSFIEYRTDDEYADHFRHLLDQSIQSRMRCNAPWGIQLSGGLDSSSIAVSARAILGNSGTEDSGILTFSMTCPGKPWDESEDIAAVVGKANLTPEFVLPIQAHLQFFRERANFWRDFPGNPNGEPMTIPMYEAARGQEARVMLNGIGGDEWLDGSPAYFADLFFSPSRAGAVRELLKRSRYDWRKSGAHRSWPVFLARKALATAAPRGVHSRRARLRLVRDGIFSREFLQRTHLADRLSAPLRSSPRRFASRTQEAVFRLVTGGYESHVFEWNDREATCAGMEIRFPFFDRRLSEFCLRLPEDQRQRGAVSKRMLRNAMRGRLPERVRTKSIKAEFSDLFGLLSAPQARARYNNLAIGQHTDWLDADRLAPKLSSLASSDRPWPGWMLLGIDLWLEDVLSSASHPAREEGLRPSAEIFP